jgi:hypothetical protein
MGKPGKTEQPKTLSGTVQTATDLAKLGEEYLQASKMLNDGFKSAPKWPTYQNAFLALENFLRAFLMLKGATLEQGRDLRALLKEAKGKGLDLNVAPAVEEVVLKASEHYPDGGNGEWSQVSPHLVITFVDHGMRGFRARHAVSVVIFSRSNRTGLCLSSLCLDQKFG